MEHSLPLLESGTLGLKCSTQTILPGLTETYSMGPAEGEDDGSSIPVCTLKSFPHLPEHTLQWARDVWEEVFVKHPEAARDYAEAVGAVGDAKEGGVEEEEGRRRWVRACKGQQGAVLRVQAVLRETRAPEDAGGAAGAAGGSKLPPAERPSTFGDCVRWARELYERRFAHSIRDLLHQHPADKVTGDGQPFWTAKKRPPAVAVFDPEDPLSLAFVLSGAFVRARAHGVPVSEEEEQAARRAAEAASALDQRGKRAEGAAGLAAGLPASITAALERAEAEMPAWVPSGEKIAASEEEAAAMAKAKGGAGGEDGEDGEEGEGAGPGAGQSMDEEVDELAGALPGAADLRGASAAGFQLSPQPFDKDDDAGMHADFVAACGNLRSRQYGIPVVERLRAKKVVGRIVPAVATTTALATALVGLELLKVIRLEGAVRATTAKGGEAALVGKEGGVPPGELRRLGRSALSMQHLQWLGEDAGKDKGQIRGGIARPLVSVAPPVSSMLPREEEAAEGEPEAAAGGAGGDGPRPIPATERLLAAFDQHNVNLALNQAHYFEPRPVRSGPVGGQPGEGEQEGAPQCNAWDSIVAMQGQAAGDGGEEEEDEGKLARARGMPALLAWLWGHLESGALTGAPDESLSALMFDGIMASYGDDREEAGEEDQASVGASCLEALMDASQGELPEEAVEERAADLKRERGDEDADEDELQEEAEKALVREVLEKRGRGLDWWKGLRQVTLHILRQGEEEEDEEEEEEEGDDGKSGDGEKEDAGPGAFPRLVFVPQGALLTEEEQEPLAAELDDE